MLRSVVAVLLWLFVGAVVYFLVGNCSEVPRFMGDGQVEIVELCPWRFSHALYFSVQTGLSIGFGLLKESTWISEAYSCVHILCGSSFIGGALSYFVTQTMLAQQEFQSRSEQRLAKAGLALHANGYDGFTLPQIRELMVMHPQYANAIIRKLHSDARASGELIQRFAAAQGSARQHVATDILHAACEGLDEFKHDSVNMSDLLDFDEKYASCCRRFTRSIRDRAPFLKALCALSLWGAVGVLFSFFADENGFVTSVYFSISTFSTAGIVPTKTVEGDLHVLFVAVFAFVGVPLYCVTLGAFADVLVKEGMKAQTQQTLNQKLSAAEVEFLGHLADGDNSEEVDLAEFTELQLLRLGLVDRETLRQIRDRFRSLDVEGRGALKKADFIHAHHLRSFASTP